jgi:hypothetical protein
VLVIRQEQQEQLKRYALEQYAERTLQQFRRYFPRHGQIIGDGPIRNMILLGVDRAKRYGIVGECNVVLYASLMLLFGSYFDEDPQFPWAAAVLGDASLSTEVQRAERLYDRGVQEWQLMAGEDNMDLVRALARSRKLSCEEIVGTAAGGLIEFFKKQYPEKARVLGEARMDGLIRESGRRAIGYGLAAPFAQSVMSVIAFCLGAAFDEDPMFPWAAQTLVSNDLKQDEKARTLHRHVTQYAEAWLVHVERGAA